MKLIDSVTRNPRCADAAGVALVLTLGLGILLGVVMPLSQQGREYQRLEEELAKTHTKSNDIAAKMSELTAKFVRVRSHLEDSPVRLRPASALNERRAKIIDLLNQNGLEIAESRSQRMTEGAQFNVVPITLTGTGTYSDCAMFLSAVHRELRDVEVVTISLSGTPDRPSVPSTFEFNLAWYASTTAPSGGMAAAGS